LVHGSRHLAIIPLDVSHEDTRQTEVRNPARCRKWRITLEAVVFTEAGERLPLDDRQVSRARETALSFRLA
jgi:hypothetical protein